MTMNDQISLNRKFLTIYDGKTLNDYEKFNQLVGRPTGVQSMTAL